jgi:hypothetical protein
LYELSIGCVFMDYVMDFKCLVRIGRNILMNLLSELLVCGIFVDFEAN